MAEVIFKILKYRLELKDDFKHWDKLRYYRDKELGEKDVEVHIVKMEEESVNYGLRHLNILDDEHLFMSEKDISVFMTCKDNYSKSKIYLRKFSPEDSFMELLMAGFYSYVSLKQTLLMHASAIEYKGKSVVFTASSGTGKTTQAELWQKYRDALILNGDKVFLKQEEDGIHAWGSPWSGSSPYAENKSAPLRAIIVLEQAKENSIRKLTGLEVMEKVFPHVFFPKWDARCENAVLDFLDEVLKNTEIYLLACRPDEEAVTLVEQTLFGEE